MTVSLTTRGKARAVALFSGGLDSILAMRLVQDQGIAVTGLHFLSPFFGKPALLRRWRKAYGLVIEPVDISGEFTSMLARGPEHGLGSVLNPCVDCKILMLRKARELMQAYDASFIISGEVLGQRPMSQRRDAMNVIRREAGVRDILLRPLCALHFEPTEPERLDLVDRSRLLSMSGRGRKEQLELAGRMGITDIPTPAGGCLLTEKENGRRYWPLLREFGETGPTVQDFHLANTGRQYWAETEHGAFWLCIGRNERDNDVLAALAGPEDYLFKTRDFPGPLALGRCSGPPWPGEVLESAASFVASYSPKARQHAEENGAPLAVRLHPGSLDGPGRLLEVSPRRDARPLWAEYAWERARREIKERAGHRA